MASTAFILIAQVFDVVLNFSGRSEPDCLYVLAIVGKLNLGCSLSPDWSRRTIWDMDSGGNALAGHGMTFARSLLARSCEESTRICFP